MKYFKGRVSKGFISIYAGRITLRIAVGFIKLFLPIFLFELFGLKIQYVILYYLLGHLLYGFIVAWGAKFLNKIGLRRSLHLSLVFGVFYYTVFYFLEKQGFSFPADKRQIFAFLALAVFVLTLDRIFYWLPLHTDLAKFTSKTNRAKELSLVEASTIIIQASAPLISGFILAHYGYNILFIIVIIIYFSAIIPFSFLPRTKERFSWTYRQSWREFFSRQRRKTVLAFAGAGAEDAVGVVVWPIFIWQLLKGNYFEVGYLTSLIVIATIIFQFLIGGITDKYNKGQIIKYGNFLYAVGWIIKIFIATAFQIFITSTYHSLSKIFARTPFDALTYERAADQGHYVDEYTVIHEMAISFGKTLMYILILILTPFVSIQWTFIFAALSSLFMNYLVGQEVVEQKRFAK